MATNADHQTQKITIKKKTVKVTNQRDEVEFPKAVKKEGKYLLPWKTDEVPPDGWSSFKYFFTPDNSNVPAEKKLDEEPLMQVMTADSSRIENPPENGIRVTWLGHASALFQLDNVNILVNPNFNNRGIKYYHPGDNKRYRPPVYEVKDLPRIDCVFITNSHFDYLDLSSVRQLNERFGEMLLWYVPQGVAEWMGKAGCVNVVELDWWKEDEVDFIDHTKLDDEEDTNTTTFNIACTPSQNYHDRTFDDDNAVLWCSWVIMSPRYKLFVSGATGYCNVFKSIGRKYGPFHMAALPVGGYEPKWKNGYGNVTPEQAVQIHQDILAMCSLALSWGTFTVGNEYYLEPPRRLNDELRKQGLSEMQFFLLKHGESRLIEIKEADKEEEPKENGHAEHCDAAEAGEVQTEPEADEEKKNDADMLQELIANLDDDPQPEAERNEDDD
ncbi:N-acyl-phosphatidylethanolamine-hydrolyzing phospholipase D-like [Hydractinia symbiolongicarpus]|uniref:N-acyl-phosphatidylethanolamine-hydrolyzing phospholipase D-like n=1 Tax=Hydractinia symbiolongicarpus TaxID=13093 RepID=UPI00254C85CC|nr:N-acyl-phosphatidylethanolamine-hydrolyzing phospholipase D-like [Hydractinia symbiolongicarpus]